MLVGRLCEGETSVLGVFITLGFSSLCLWAASRGPLSPRKKRASASEGAAATRHFDAVSRRAFEAGLIKAIKAL